MRRINTIAAAVALALVAASPSLAGVAEPSSFVGEGDKKFPIAAAEFRKHVGAKVDQARARLEKYIVTKELTKEQADALRARCAAALVKLDKRVDEVCADGIVTREEADSVHVLAKALLHEIRSGE